MTPLQISEWDETIEKDKDYKTVACMEKYGGSFTHALALAFMHADRFNYETLKNSFPEIWKEYKSMSESKSI